VSAILVSADRVVVYRGKRRALDEVTLSVAAGEVIAILGPNGAGKSTLLQAIAGILEADSGTISRNGRVAAALQSPALARPSVLANIELALAWWGVPRGRERTEQAMTALRNMRADHLAQQAALTLSGGEARRVHLARTLATNADVLLLDEPFAGLDSSTRADLLYESASALRDPARAVVVIVHDRAEARALADRVVVLLEGRVRADGQPKEVFDQPPDEQVAEFLGYEGWLVDGNTRVRFRPSDVQIVRGGPVAATVTRTVPLEYGVRVELAALGGELIAHVSEPGPAIGSQVQVQLSAGARFPAAAITSSPNPLP
jgi:ABC-type sulfate/molybdate transport systems ATPase subunit